MIDQLDRQLEAADEAIRTAQIQKRAYLAARAELINSIPSGDPTYQKQAPTPTPVPDYTDHPF